MTLSRRIVAELVGTTLLLLAVTGSGIMGERLAEGNIAIALLANSLATGGALIALILIFGPISGAHFNPVVTLALSGINKTGSGEVVSYIAAQFVGALMGVWLAHLIFSLPLLELSGKDRGGIALMTSEFVATFGLLMVIISSLRSKPESIPYGVAAYITGAYWFTSSTSFANPAVTLARAFSDTFVGIQLWNVPGFILAQLLALWVTWRLARWWFDL